MKRLRTKHEGKILKTKIETEIEGRRLPKVKESFKIQSNSESRWYHKDGIKYTGDANKKLHNTSLNKIT